MPSTEQLSYAQGLITDLTNKIGGLNMAISAKQTEVNALMEQKAAVEYTIELFQNAVNADLPS